MKRLILLAGSMLAMLQVTAQELPGSVFVTAGIGVNMQQNDENNTSKTLHVSPSVNYLLNERWSLGLFFEHSRNTLNTETRSTTGSGYYTSYQELNSKYRSFFAGPQVRYYQHIVSKLFFLSEAQTGFKLEKQEVTQKYSSYYNDGGQQPVANEESNSKASATSLQVNISPGLVYFIKPKFGIELKTNVLNYNYGLGSSRLPNNESDSRNFNADFSLANTKFGASFYF